MPTARYDRDTSNVGAYHANVRREAMGVSHEQISSCRRRLMSGPGERPA
jgi:hypothetical protein